jgi:transcriptional regulator with XRE-family HTH domain
MTGNQDDEAQPSPKRSARPFPVINRATVLPVREPGASALPPTNPRLLGGCGSLLPSPDAVLVSKEDAGRPSVDQLRRSLGGRLKMWRVAVGFSQQQLAARTGFSRSTVAGVESGSRRTARDFWVRCDAALGAGGVLLARYRVVVAEQERESRDQARQAEAECEDPAVARRNESAG